MSNSNPWSAMSILILCLIALLVSPIATQAQEPFKESYTAFGVAMGTTNPPVLPSGMTVNLQINVTRWTTDEERADLFAQLVENGQEALVKALQKQEETGWIRVTGPPRLVARATFPSERLRYAREIPGEGGTRRLILALDRPISMGEAVRQPRWRDYDVTLIVLDLDAEGKGEGELAMAVRLAFDRDNKRLVIENFGTEPIRLTRVTMNK
jgi:hypothetical protein